MSTSRNRDGRLVPGFTRIQFPAGTCIAITVAKSQGHSVSGRLGLDLRDMCVSSGQLYVAMSRTTHQSNVLICGQRVDNATFYMV